MHISDCNSLTPSFSLILLYHVISYNTSTDSHLAEYSYIWGPSTLNVLDSYTATAIFIFTSVYKLV